MQPWAANGKRVAIRVSASGWTAWQPPYSAKGTPQWVYDLGVPSVTEDDGAIKPQYWSPIFQQHFSDFVHAFACHYDGNSHIAFVEIGVGDGGETKVDTHNNSGSQQNQHRLQLWTAIGYSDQVWWNTIQQIINIYIDAFHSTPLALMPTSSFIGKTGGYNESLVVNYAVSHHLWLQDNGLIPNRTLSGPWKQVPIIEEQRNQTSVSGDSLQADLQAALNVGATYIMVFESDISSANQATLLQVASLAHP
jgi:hypothetical protein